MGAAALLAASVLTLVARPGVDVALAATAVGATTPFTSYEAEAGTLGGGASVVALTSAPTTQYSSAALEASGHAYVHLTGAGQSVQWTNNTGQPITFINVRASIPDAPSGGGMTATLDLYVNGAFRQALNLNSRQSWLYEGNNNYNGNDQNPADGDPRVFFDESHTFVSGAAIAPGDTITLKKDSSNTAAFYDIDVIDVENPPAPASQPANSISITSCGAVADNNPTNGAADPGAADSTGAIQNCINQAQSQHKILWIPQGTFYLKGTNGLQANGITIEGAGMWYSTIYRDVPLPNNVGLAAAFSVTSCTLENFHIDSDATSRATVDGGGGAMDTSGTNWVANGMWAQHAESGMWASGTGGTVENNRFTSIWADGVNLNNVSLNNSVGNHLTATNNFVRGTGDDAMAINSVNYNQIGNNTVYYTPMSDVTLTHNTLEAPWGGKGIGIYGGSGHIVEDNYIADTARYIGLGVGKFGANGSDLTSATVSGNEVVRAGGNAYNQGQPALHIGNGGDGQSTGTVTGASVTGNTIINSLYDSVGFSTSTNTNLQGNTIVSPWRNGIVISPPFYPAPSGSATISGNSVTGLRSGMSAFVNNSSGFSASVSDNSWQGALPEGPYGGTPAAVPGTVQAENYDTGGQGVAYNVNSVNGSGNGYRGDGVDLEATSDAGGGSDLGWTSGGQWFRYTVDVATAGTYTLSLRVAAPSAVTDALHIASASGASLSGSVNVPATGDWQAWTTVGATVTLPAGRQTLTLDEDNGGWNLNNLTFAASTNANCSATVSGTALSRAGWSVSTNTAASGGDAASNAIDGNLSTRFSSDAYETPGQYWQANLGSAQSFDELQMQATNSSGDYARGYDVEVSGNGSSWTTVASCTGVGDPEVVSFPAQTAQYVRVVQTGNSSSNWWSIDELNLYGAGGGGGIDSSAWYEVVNENSAACVDAIDSGTANGTIVQQWSCGGSTNQQWQFRDAGSGYYDMLNRNAATENEVWDVTGGASATSSGVGIQTWSYGGGTNQQWQAVSVGGGYYEFVARNSGLCLDVPNASTANGVQLQQYACNGSPAQAFQLVRQS